MSRFEHLFAPSHIESNATHVNRPLPKPVSATVLGIFHLVLGIPGLLLSPVHFLAIHFIESYDRTANPAWDVMRDTPGYMTFHTTVILIGIGMTALLVAAGVGLLKGKRSGRTLSIFYSCVALIVGIGATFVQFHFLYEPLSKIEDPAAASAMAGGIVGASLGSIYPMLTLYFMYRRNVIEYFR